MFFALGLELLRKAIRNALGVKDWDEEGGKSLRQRTQPRGKVAGGGGGVCKFCSPLSFSCPPFPSAPLLFYFSPPLPSPSLSSSLLSFLR